MSKTILKPLFIAVCDDDEKDLAHIGQMVSDYILNNGITAELTYYNSAAEILKDVRAGKAYQLFVLDVMLGDSDGICLAAELRKMKQRAEIIFVSSSREMALLGYEVDAARYLAKPPEESKLKEALDFCFERLSLSHSIMLPTRSGGRSFDLSEFRYVEPWDGFCRVHMKNGDTEFIMQKFHELSELLPSEQFVQVHRTLLVNMADIRYIRRSEIELCNGERLPVSKYRIEELRSRYLEYMEK